jgi:hypothetical protein
MVLLAVVVLEVADHVESVCALRDDWFPAVYAASPRNYRLVFLANVNYPKH